MRPEPVRQRDDLLDMIQVLPVHDRVDGQRQAQLAHPAGDLQLARVAVAAVADAVGVDRIAVLYAQLDVVHARGLQRRKPLAREQHPGGDEVVVQARRAGRGDQLLEVAARGGLTAGEVHLQHAQRGGLPEHVDPLLGAELLAAPAERNRVGAVGTLQRAAVGQLRQHRQRRLDGGHRALPALGVVDVHEALLRQHPEQRQHVVLDHLARRVELGAQRSDHRVHGSRAGAALENLATGLVEHQHALRRLDHPALTRRVVLQTREAGQPRPAAQGDPGRLAQGAGLVGVNAPGGTSPGAT